MKTLRTLVLLSVMAIALSGCSSSKMSRSDRAIVGGVVGAAGGAAVSKSANGAIFGGLVGAGIGALSH